MERICQATSPKILVKLGAGVSERAGVSEQCDYLALSTAECQPFQVRLCVYTYLASVPSEAEVCLAELTAGWKQLACLFAAYHFRLQKTSLDASKSLLP